DTWTGTTWFIEGDISDCFGSLDHTAMVGILSEKIHDNRFLRLVRNMLQAGYLEDWVWNATLSGAPQGGVASPVLSSIYLHKLDVFVETVLVPQYTRGRLRTRSREYNRVHKAMSRARQRGDRATARTLGKRLRSLPSGDPQDPGYRRLRYVRYADDHLLGFIGPKAEAEEIKQRLAAFLRDDLKLELSQDKTLITHARTGAARFLGYEITVQHDDRKVTRNHRTINGTIGLRVPRLVIKAKCAPFLRRGKPTHRPQLTNLGDYDIVRIYGAEYRGIVQYYLLAGDVWRLRRLRWVMETSMLRTLARKHHSTVTKTAARLKTKVDTPHGPRTVIEAHTEREGRNPLVARFGGIPLKRRKDAAINDRVPGPARTHPRKELVIRLLRRRCEMCEHIGQVQVHQVRRLADLDPGPERPAWIDVMAKRRRKTLVVCQPCHDYIHAGQPTTLTA
ncbi:MAG TPA: group II intron reverse transcriptase/maturase, partial [Pseudonocardiaceae bacterium]|nr:group II intron reverse transcriptase/maturase [Pseudonocardiaceae bacterium]